MEDWKNRPSEKKDPQGMESFSVSSSAILQCRHPFPLPLRREFQRERERERESSVYSILCTNELHRLGKGGRVWALRIRTRPSSLVRRFANELDFKHVQFICYCWACRHFSSSFSVFFFFFFLSKRNSFFFFFIKEEIFL